MLIKVLAVDLLKALSRHVLASVLPALALARVCHILDMFLLAAVKAISFLGAIVAMLRVPAGS